MHDCGDDLNGCLRLVLAVLLGTGSCLPMSADDSALFGEQGAYVPCNEAAAELPSTDDDSAAISGHEVGYVPVDVAAAALPADTDDSDAISGHAVGFVAKPCVYACDSCVVHNSNEANDGPSGTSWQALSFQRLATVDNDGTDHPTGAAHDEVQSGPSFSRLPGSGVGVIQTEVGPAAFAGPEPFAGDPFHVTDRETRHIQSFVKPSFPAVPTHFPTIWFIGDLALDSVTISDRPALGDVPWQLVAVSYDSSNLTSEDGLGAAGLDLVAFPQSVIASGVHTGGHGATQHIDVAFPADETQNRVAFFLRTSTDMIAAHLTGDADPRWVVRYPLYPAKTYFGGGIVLSIPTYTVAYCTCPV